MSRQRPCVPWRHKFSHPTLAYRIDDHLLFGAGTCHSGAILPLKGWFQSPISIAASSLGNAFDKRTGSRGRLSCHWVSAEWQKNVSTHTLWFPLDDTSCIFTHISFHTRLNSSRTLYRYTHHLALENKSCPRRWTLLAPSSTYRIIHRRLSTPGAILLQQWRRLFTRTFRRPLVTQRLLYLLLYLLSPRHP